MQHLPLNRPKYLRRRGTPRQASDLSGHDALIYSSVLGDDVWRLTTPKGEVVTVNGRYGIRIVDIAATENRLAGIEPALCAARGVDGGAPEGRRARLPPPCR